MTTKSTKKAAPKKAPAKKAAKASSPPTTSVTPKTSTKRVPPTRNAPSTEEHVRDPRLPAPGTILTRAFNGKEYRVEILEAGFRHDGRVWRSLSAIAKAISGTSWNGHLFWGTQKRAKAPAPDAQKDGAK